MVTRRRIVAVNLALIVVLLICYLVTMLLLRYYTVWVWPSGQWGGALAYAPFRVSTIYHLASSGFQPVFYLPDIVSYILTAIIILNLFMLISRKLSSSETKLYFGQTAVAALSLPIYMITMTFVEDALKHQHWSKDAAGAVFYYPFFVVGATPTYQGHFEGAGETFLPDVLAWLIILLLVSAIIVAVRQHREHARNMAEKE
jgi:hypothetical protein